MTTLNSQISDEPENEYLQELEEPWRKSQPRFTDSLLLEIFSDALENMEEKIDELTDLQKSYKKKILELDEKYNNGDDINSYFAELCIEYFLIKEDLGKIEKSLFLIKRLNYQKNKPKNRKKSWLTPEDIENAKNASLIQIAEQHIGQLKKSGTKYIGKCPFHEENTPSFYIYSESNSFYCFGCNSGGDVIKFIQTIMGFSFKEAIYYLIQK